MRLEIICTGDEILTGKIVNTNFSHISRKLEEIGLSVQWGTTVGDDSDTLLEAFQQAAKRADAVIVNGGLGPTVDDLSQEIAAKAAGVELVLNEGWLAQIQALFERYGMVMQPNNRKQAMLPATAALIDNPIGTACGFEMDIGQARFYFTPGVPKELHLMLDAEIFPRLLARSGAPGTVRVKRFHAFGLGESHVDSMLSGIEALDPKGGVKLGFQTHYPQLEIKLSINGASPAELSERLAPVEAEVRRRVGNFILAEDDETLEGIVLAALRREQASLAVVETFTCGLIAARLAQVPEAQTCLRRGVMAPAVTELEAVLGLDAGTLSGGALTEERVVRAARAAEQYTGASHALVALMDADGGSGQSAEGGAMWFGIAAPGGVAVRRSRLRLVGGDWLLSGAVEMGLDSMRRLLLGLPVTEKIDFEHALQAAAAG